MHLFSLKPWDVDGMTVSDFMRACDWINERNKPRKGGR